MQTEHDPINTALSLIIIFALGVTILTVGLNSDRGFFYDQEKELRDQRISVYLNVINK